jgi:transposase-like protein
MIETDLGGEVVEPSSSVAASKSAFAGFRFPPELIVVAIRWYPRFDLSYRNVEELPVERGAEYR